MKYSAIQEANNIEKGISEDIQGVNKKAPLWFIQKCPNFLCKSHANKFTHNFGNISMKFYTRNRNKNIFTNYKLAVKEAEK